MAGTSLSHRSFSIWCPIVVLPSFPSRSRYPSTTRSVVRAMTLNPLLWTTQPAMLMPVAWVKITSTLTGSCSGWFLDASQRLALSFRLSPTYRRRWEAYLDVQRGSFAPICDRRRLTLHATPALGTNTVWSTKEIFNSLNIWTCLQLLTSRRVIDCLLHTHDIKVLWWKHFETEIRYFMSSVFVLVDLWCRSLTSLSKDTDSFLRFSSSGNPHIILCIRWWQVAHPWLR